MQSGKKLVGAHVPFDPQTHILDRSCCAKSDLLLQNGEQKEPNIQSSQALAPFKGVFSFGHSVAIEGKNIREGNMTLK